MEKLVRQYVRRINIVSTRITRYLLHEVDWSERLIAIKGSRGVGKTTLLLQQIKLNHPKLEETLYASLDDVYFQGNALLDLAEEFYINGGKYLFLDEVHKYDNWSLEIKNIYDNYPDLNVVFTSSSLLEINKGNADLSRRAVTYELKGLSFREYLCFENQLNYPRIDLNEILSNHVNIAQDIIKDFKIIPHFKKYLEIGYYPFYKEAESSYYSKLTNVINLTIESDIPAVYNTEFKTINKIKRLLYVVSTALPYIPNISKLSEYLETSSRNSTLQYLHYLDLANLTSNLKTSARGNNYLRKPDKIYLENTNLIMTLGNVNITDGTMRETFFNNQLGVKHQVNTSKESDFLVDEELTFEVGGKNKNTSQIKTVKNSFIAADNIEVGLKNKIPLWLFGFTY